MIVAGIGRGTSARWVDVFTRYSLVTALGLVFAGHALAIQVAGGQSATGSIARATHHSRSHSKAHSGKAKKKVLSLSSKSSAKPVSPSDAAPQPATVSFQNGSLTVNANNSDLTQILRKVADISGMSIDGLNKSARVFGVYGPGDPSQVLTEILSDSGYNFVMVGNTADGAPRQLLLTAKNGGTPGIAPTPPFAAAPGAAQTAAPETPVNPVGNSVQSAGNTDQNSAGDAPAVQGNNSYAAPMDPSLSSPEADPQDAAGAQRLQQNVQRLTQMNAQQNPQ